MSEPSAKKAKVDGEAPLILPLDEPLKAKLMELDLVQIDLDQINEQAADEILKIEQTYNKKRQPYFNKRKALIQTIDGFWHTAFLNHHQLSLCVPEDDEEFLVKLRDIEVEEFEDIKSGYKIKMTFDKNEYFENETIVKSYFMNAAENPYSTTTEIIWKPGKKPVVKDHPEGESLTFLEWLVLNVPPDSDEISEVIKDDLYPNPLQYYIMPEMNEGDDEELEEFIDEEEECNGNHEEEEQNGQ